MNRNHRNTKRNNKNNNKSTTELSNLHRKGAAIINLSRYLCQPDQLLIRLRYNVQYQINHAGQPSASKSYYINGMYDVDPAVGSTAIPGFTSWTQLYGSYRVETTRFKLQLASQEAFPVGVFDLFRPDPAYSSANSIPVTIAGNRTSEFTTLSQAGGMDRTKINRTIAPKALLGDDSTYEGSIVNFTGTSLTNPSSQMIFGVCVTPINPADTMVNGVSMWGYIDFYVRLFNPLRELV